MVTETVETIRLAGFNEIKIDESCCGKPLLVLDVQAADSDREWKAECPECHSTLTLTLGSRRRA